MTKKFNPKHYRGKPRVYSPVPNAPRISRLWVWDPLRSEYLPPERGKCYMARRNDLSLSGKRARVTSYFETLDEARQWTEFGKGEKVKVETANGPSHDFGPSLGSIAEEWRRRSFTRLAPGTRLQYERMLRRHFDNLLSLGVHAISPARIDEWLDSLRNPSGSAMQSKNRMGFQHELTLLGTLLNYYGEYHEDAKFMFPIKDRHREMAKPNGSKQAKQKDLPESEFLSFRAKVSEGKYGTLMATLATVQYYQALRVSEAAALHWEDVALDSGTVYVRRYIYWPRRRGIPSEVRLGFKNAKAVGGLKELPLMQESVAEALKQLLPSGKPSGLVFHVEGKLLEYRWIQFAYDSAFKAAGLPYTGTHVMRHGGARRVLNQTGDLSLAQQLLGNTDMRSTLVYAQRDKTALRAFAKGEWKNLALVANGRIFSGSV